MDGRHLRSERTKRLIVEAYMVLVREGAQMPTAVQIAERAGYSVRSIFERFPDLHALRVAATDYAIGEAKAAGMPRDLDADRDTRIRSQVEARATGCERWLPLWRVLNANASDSAELQQRIKVIRQLIVMRIEAMFRPELSALPDVERKRTVLALEALMDFESWARMKEMFGLSREEACNVWIRAIDRLLPPAPPAPPIS
ncbi:TetR/AcrR family transcriptional regulator [Enhydrobacter aerosaccus]|uniref:TetR/AcrR family transcriptional regulator n=1 Tax=Enhydrobacter aerosaccus TaxID=225324 RepID=UPI000A2F074A|nr:TetR/AcrR family transcriptional regulator [Enhydrobacter aerosaccus]